jgi:hypothetical protein
MRFSRLSLFVSLLLLCPWAVSQPFKRDLTIELRQIEVKHEATEGYRAGTAAPNSSLTPQVLLVRNGEKATLRMQQSVPMQWVKSAQSQNTSLKISGAEATSSGGGVTQELHWFEVGQSMTVTPKWLGGKKNVALEIEVQQADMQTVHNADMPRQTRKQLSTTVTVPLNVWVTIASSGAGLAPAGSYSSNAGTEVQRSMQVRVSAP